MTRPTAAARTSEEVLIVTHALVAVPGACRPAFVRGGVQTP